MLTFKEYTVEEYIADYRDTDVTLDKLFYRAVHSYDTEDSYVMNETCILDEYWEDLIGDVTRNVTGDERNLYEGYSVLTLSDKEVSKYKFNPKGLSYDLYGTTELWWLILRLNELYSATEFSIESKKVKLFSIGVLDKISEILNREEDRININQDEVNQGILDAQKN